MATKSVAILIPECEIYNRICKGARADATKFDDAADSIKMPAYSEIDLDGMELDEVDDSTIARPEAFRPAKTAKRVRFGRAYEPLIAIALIIPVLIVALSYDDLLADDAPPPLRPRRRPRRLCCRLLLR